MILRRGLRAPSLRVDPELQQNMCQLQHKLKNQGVVKTHDGGKPLIHRNQSHILKN